MDANRDPQHNPALLLAAVAAAVLLVLHFGYVFLEGPARAAIDPTANGNFTKLAYFLDRLSYLAGAGVITLAAVSAGLFVLERLRAQELPAVEEFIWAFAIGLGLLSLVTFAVALAGFLRKPAAFAILVIMAALGGRRLGDVARRLTRKSPRKWSLSEKALLAIAGLAALTTVVYAYNPPIDFDALEYHLSAPVHWFRTGSVRYISHNVYSNFPAGSEMLYLLSMAVTGSKFTGAILGKVLHAVAALAAAGAAFSLGRWLLSRAAGIYSAAALLTAGAFFHVSTAAYVEPLQVLYTLLAVLGLGRFIQKGRISMLAASAVAAGLAMGVKYPSALFTAGPLALAAALGSGGLRARLRNILLFGAIAAAVVSPWLAKNFIMTGNPVYPLLYGLFGGKDWSALQDARWAFAHTPKGGLAWEQWERHVFGVFFSNELVSFLSFAFVAAMVFARRVSKRGLFVLAYVSLYVFLWFAATHRVDRFLLPGLAVLGCVSGAGLFSLPRGWIRSSLSWLAVFMAALNLFFMSGVYGQAIGLAPSVPLFGQYESYLREKMPPYETWEYLNEEIPSDAKVLLIAEAETFYLDFDFSATTVFDRKPLEDIAIASGGDPGAIAMALQDRGIDYIFVNWATFRRQQESYEFEFEGRLVPGYSAAVNPALFADLAAAGKIRPLYAAGGDVYPGVPAYVLYCLEPQ